jgi:putative FmdB family regulatory protein
MPIYEYQCQKCQERLEVMQRISDEPLKTCPECGGDLKKLISAPAFQFKGSGWYVTDYARKTGEGAEAAKSEGTKSDGKGGAAEAAAPGAGSETSSKAADSSKETKKTSKASSSPSAS